MFDLKKEVEKLVDDCAEMPIDEADTYQGAVDLAFKRLGWSGLEAEVRKAVVAKITERALASEVRKDHVNE